VSPGADGWAEWQRDHASALAALQKAQRAYHRAAVGSQPPAAASRKESLDALNAARAKLDEVRDRMPR
jgi:hypothetical protein